jgi:multiple sugar transport system permease protein
MTEISTERLAPYEGATTRDRRPKRRRNPAGHGLAGVLFVLPVLVLFALLLIGPLLYALYLSLFSQRLVGGNVFTAFDNYSEALKDSQFTDGLLRMLVFMLVQVPIMLGLALVFALILDSGRVWLPSVWRLGIFVPYAVPTVVAALMWGFLYGSDFGLIGQTADAIGVKAPNLLSRELILPAIANVVTWSFTGYNMVILYAALRAIPEELYDAAAVDGAGPILTARYIKLPLLRPALLLCTIFSVIGSFQLFNEPAVMDQIAPQAISKSYTPNLYIYNLAFSDQRLNYAAALSFILGLVVFVLSYTVMFLSRRRGS